MVGLRNGICTLWRRPINCRESLESIKILPTHPLAGDSGIMGPEDHIASRGKKEGVVQA